MHLKRLLSASSVTSRCVSGSNIYLPVNLIIFHAYASEASQGREINGFQPLTNSKTTFSSDVKRLLSFNTSNAMHFAVHLQGKNLCNLVKIILYCPLVQEVGSEPYPLESELFPQNVKCTACSLLLAEHDIQGY